MKHLFTILILLVVGNSFAQISHGGQPLSFSKTITQNIAVYTTPNQNIQKLINEDAVTDKYKDIAWRFGIEISVNINLNNAGTWETLLNGDRVWRIILKSPNAKTININYSNFYLPKGTRFFVYNKNGVLGSFTSLNNKVDEKFATSLLKGNTITLEYFEPLAVTGKGKIQISGIVHGYRDLFHQLKSFGSSGSCNVNAVCDSTIWGDEIRSSVMLLTAGNTRFCSGALINNTLNDGTPYVLTANHCNPATNSLFMFNYQSPNCTPSSDGVTTQTISGCTVMANDTTSDFFLVKLTSTPPANYKSFYAGWSNIDTIPINGTGIHHPSGDVTKISHDFDNLASSGYYNAGDNHWEVLDWNTGTTEAGSSGSPLFDQNHRIVGQLHGGDAACGNDAFDYFGKFAVSWNNSADTLRQLKYWLDPINTGATTNDGFDPSGSFYTTDVAVLSLIGIPKRICGDSATPKITFKNKGNDTLTAVNILYTIDGNTPNTIAWTGNLPTYTSTLITLPTIHFTNGSHNITVYTSNPNGIADQNIFNDSVSYNFSVNTVPLMASLVLTTDDYGAETSWYIKDNTTGNIVAVSGGYSNVAGGQTFNESICLYDACFTFVLKDAYKDGYCCAYGNGSTFLSENATGDTLVLDNTFNGDSLIFSFCMGTAVAIKELKTTNLKITPNPNNGKFTITLSKKNISPISINVFDMLGKIIYSRNNITKNNIQLNLRNVQKGIYFVAITSKTAKIVRKILIE